MFYGVGELGEEGSVGIVDWGVLKDEGWGDEEGGWGVWYVCVSVLGIGSVASARDDGREKFGKRWREWGDVWICVGVW